MAPTIIHVHTWFPQPIPDRSTQLMVDDINDHITTRVWNGSVRIWGRLHQGNATHNWWRSSSVVRIVSPTTFVTRNGTLVSIVGPMYTPYARKFNLSNRILSEFRNGLPEDWITQLCQEPHSFYSASPFVIEHALQQFDQKAMFRPCPIKPMESTPQEIPDTQSVVIEPEPQVSAPKSRPSLTTRRVSFLEPVAILSSRPTRTRRKSAPSAALSAASSPDSPSDALDTVASTRPPEQLGPVQSNESKPRPRRASAQKVYVSLCTSQSATKSPRTNSRRNSPTQPTQLTSQKHSKIIQGTVSKNARPRRAASLAAKLKILQDVPTRKAKRAVRPRALSTNKISKAKLPKSQVSVQDVPVDEETTDKTVPDACFPPKTRIVSDHSADEGKEDHAKTSQVASHTRKRVAFAPGLSNDDPLCGVSQEANDLDGPPITELANDQWSHEQRDAFQRQRNLIAANLPDYWERVAARVPGKNGDDCRSLWLSNWTSPLPNMASRKKRRVATPEVVLHVRKASKQKRSRETAIYRSNVRRLAEVVARNTNDDALEPHIVTPTTLPGAKQLLELAAGGDGSDGRILMDGTPGSEVRQWRVNMDKQSELVTPEILARGKKLGFQESDHYVALFKKRIGSAALCAPTIKNGDAGEAPARASGLGEKKTGTLLGKRSRNENLFDYDSRDATETADFDDDDDDESSDDSFGTGCNSEIKFD